MVLVLALARLLANHVRTLEVGTPMRDARRRQVGTGGYLPLTTHTTVQCDNHMCAYKPTNPHAAHSRVHGKHCHQPIHLPRREPPSTTTPTTANTTTTACAVANGWLEL